jgi:hypothetical protein
MITGAAVLIVDGTYPAANGQRQAPPGRFIVITFIEEAAGAHAIKAPFTVFLPVPDNRRREGFLRELNEGDSENISLT